MKATPCALAAQRAIDLRAQSAATLRPSGGVARLPQRGDLFLQFLPSPLARPPQRDAPRPRHCAWCDEVELGGRARGRNSRRARRQALARSLSLRLTRLGSSRSSKNRSRNSSWVSVNAKSSSPSPSGAALLPPAAAAALRLRDLSPDVIFLVAGQHVVALAAPAGRAEARLARSLRTRSRSSSPDARHLRCLRSRMLALLSFAAISARGAPDEALAVTETLLPCGFSRRSMTYITMASAR